MSNASHHDDEPPPVDAPAISLDDNRGNVHPNPVPSVNHHEDTADLPQRGTSQLQEAAAKLLSIAVQTDDAVEGMSADDLPPEIRVEGRAPPTTSEDTGRNLIVCIDGTANQFGRKNTHVVELYSRLVKDDKQLTYYDSGIGTYAKESGLWTRMKQKVEHTVDMAIAINHKRITLSAYQWLSENYIPGDKIYLFGFSRGAYQVRIISGMIEIVGLLHKGNNNQIAFAYQLYLAMIKVEKRQKGSKVDDTRDVCQQFKRTLSHEHFKVHFVGVWDTVSSIGVTRGPSFPETTSGMGHVRAFRHAISLNERRLKFLPEHANGGSGPDPDLEVDIKEVWFIGSHSDIGGGNDVNITLDHFGPSLRWMLYEAMDHGVRTIPLYKAWGEPKPTSSMKWYWWTLEVLPLKRLSYNGDPDKSAADATVRRPHFAAPRRIQKGQLIHESAITYLKKGYPVGPTALIRDEDDGVWRPLPSVYSTISPNMIEGDSHTKIAAEVLAILRTTEPSLDVAASAITVLMASEAGHQSLVDAISSAEKANLLRTAVRRTLEMPKQEYHKLEPQQKTYVNAFAGALALLRSNRKKPPPEPLKAALDWLPFVDPELYGPITLMNCDICTLRGHTQKVFSVAYSPNGTLIASGSGDGTIRLWDTLTGQSIGELLQGHGSIVTSVAFSPDGKCIVSGSADHTIRIWNAETRQPIGSPLTGNKDTVNSVTFSPNGRLIASGSSDTTVRIWDAQTGRAVGEPLRGHTDWVRPVAFSPDGRRIASGSDDQMVCIWDVGTRDVVRVLEGHSGWVLSVVFSPDGRLIVSGSWDGTIRVCDVETGETVLGPLEGHTGYVRAVAVSPDGRYIASGSSDCTVRLWDAQKGETVSEPLRGHTDSVSSVAFSPDSRHVVSGSIDKSLMIWEVV